MLEVPTLPDYLTDGLDIVFVGLNPSEFSVQAGHYFANPRNRFWAALNGPEGGNPRDRGGGSARPRTEPANLTDLPPASTMEWIVAGFREDDLAEGRCLLVGPFPGWEEIGRRATGRGWMVSRVESGAEAFRALAQGSTPAAVILPLEMRDDCETFGRRLGHGDEASPLRVR